jgi:hypothetical protein
MSAAVLNVVAPKRGINLIFFWTSVVVVDEPVVGIVELSKVNQRPAANTFLASFLCHKSSGKIS